MQEKNDIGIQEAMKNGPSNFFFDAFYYQFMGKIGVGIRNKFL